MSLGEWNITSEENCIDDICYKPVVYGVEETTVHEKYEAESRHQLYDVALLRLNETVTYTR